ncbi:hypothetical protein GA0070608_2812 [Micromonospora peucetia]|uniref:Uncharacterized protein n=1 Tax=Micromonospora peucetia TaxID=47871 RepID=A0A1C6VCH4_9ACTN|nr:hypothetical protein GA0070608_2812 [Micromonospora peucetia]
MKVHRTDIVSFAFGLVFLGLAAWWLLAQLLGLALPPVGWFLAGALILIGLLGLVGALRSGRSADAATSDVATDATSDSAFDAPGAAEAVSTPPASELVHRTSDRPATESEPVDRTSDRPATEVDPTRWDLDRAAPADDPAAWGGQRSDWGERSDWGGRPERDEADEWPTEAVTDVRPEAVEDRAADEEDAPAGRGDEPSAGGERQRG